ncbi:MAG: ferredoxin III, nif-specific [Nitrospinae bacterium]|nr:ferredoxin III, nif-specific [Nitrospinota bacterium]
MEQIVSYRKNGTPFTPLYIAGVNHEKCIGCGRCFKVCGEEVFTLVERATLGLEDDDYEDEGAMVMKVKDDGNCIGCSACKRVCPKGAVTHAV